MFVSARAVARAHLGSETLLEPVEEAGHQRAAARDEHGVDGLAVVLRRVVVDRTSDLIHQRPDPAGDDRLDLRRPGAER